jgi:MFS family permease
MKERKPPADGIMANPDFVKLWVGETISLTGTQVTMFALPLIGVLTLHASVFQVGLLNAMRTIPVLFFSLFAGVWLDRRRRRPVMIVCSLGNAILIGLVPVSYGLGVLTLTLLFVVCIVSGVLSVVFDVGVQTYVPSIIERGHLSASNSRMQTSYSISLAAGPGLAGLLVGLITAPVTLSVDAVSYLCSAIGLLSIRKPEAEPAKPAEQTSILKSIGEGLAAVYGNKILRYLLILSGTFNFVQSAFITVFMVYAVRDEHASSVRLGIVLAAIALGGIVGAMYTNRIGARLGVGLTMFLGIVMAVTFPMALLIPHDFSVPAVLLMSAAEFCYGFGVLAFNVHAITLRQAITPNRLLGRSNASYRLVVVGTAPLGAILIGVLGDYTGLHFAFAASVLAFPAALITIPLCPAFRLKEIPPRVADEDEDENGPAGDAQALAAEPKPADATAASPGS